MDETPKRSLYAQKFAAVNLLGPAPHESSAAGDTTQFPRKGVGLSSSAQHRLINSCS